MVIIFDVILGYICITVFQLTERLAIAVTKSRKAVYKGFNHMLGFSYPAIPSRHEITWVLHL